MQQPRFLKSQLLSIRKSPSAVIRAQLFARLLLRRIMRCYSTVNWTVLLVAVRLFPSVTTTLSWRPL